MSHDGGGASRSTDPAAGTSSATDVSLREFVAVRIDALDRHLTSDIEALRRESDTANHVAARATEVAAAEAKERLAAHNGLIEQMRAQAEANTRERTAHEALFAKQETFEEFKEAQDKRLGRIERFQAMLTGGMILVSFIGIANLVKIWTG
jgi:hypothetical protein